MIIKGQKINDRYEIIRNIGEGGMANVYLALDTILNRKVAVKVLRGDLATDEKFVRKFQREASAASNLDHPNIVGIYDVGEDNGNYFIVMEYVEGQTLKSLIKRRGSLTLPEVLDIMTQLTSGIAHAHQNGIIHRDIKPQNVLILDDGLIKIADFGIAHALNSEELTQTNSVMGSVHYLPPEQANGEQSTFKSDIYSLGILMFELLTGHVPFKGENAVEIAIKQMKDPIPSIRDIKTDIPQSVENIILKATAKNPKNRYDKVDDMKYDLKTCLDEDKLNVPKLKFQYPEFEKDEEQPKVVKSRQRRNEELNNLSETTELEKAEDKKNNKRLKIVIIALGVLLAIIIGVVLAITSRNNTKTIEIPDVSNKSVSDATRELEKLGLKVNAKDKEIYSDEIETDKVIKTDPRAGKNVKSGTKITLYISIGSEGFEVENYVGKKFEDVKADLEGKGITVKSEDEEYSDQDNIEDGVILKQNIEVGQKIKKGDEIIFTIPNIIVTYPDFVKDQATEKTVTEFCKKNELICVSKTKETTTSTAGTVIEQSRAAGTKVVKGANFSYTLAKAPEVIVATDISLGSQSVSISVGGTTKVPATLVPNNVTNQSLKWNTANNSIAAVTEDGTIMGIAAGSTTVTVTSGDGKVTKNISVTVQ